MTKVMFKPNIEKVTETKGIWSVDEIKKEPMLFGASYEFARSDGGIITNMVLDNIEDDMKKHIEEMSIKGYHPVIDTKSVMLMPQWFPSIPGWHCDGVIRPDAKSQPDLNTIKEDIIHYIYLGATISDLSCPIFIAEDLELDVDKNAVWKSVHNSVSDVELDKKLTYMQTYEGDIVKFNRSALHICSPSKLRGWRYFFRLSFYHMPAMNEIRNQVQTYIDVNTGW